MGIATEAKIDLAVAGVHGNDACCPLLQQAVGEAASGGANIKTDFAGDIDVPMLKRFFQLEAATADVLQAFAQNTEVCFCVYASASLFDFLSINQHFAGEDQRLGALARCCHAALQDQFVESDFQPALRKAAYHLVRRELPLKCQHPSVCKKQKRVLISHLRR